MAFSARSLIIGFGVLLMACGRSGPSSNGEARPASSGASRPAPVPIPKRVSIRYDSKHGGAYWGGDPGTTFELTGLWRYVPAPDIDTFFGKPADAPRGAWERVPLGPDPIVHFEEKPDPHAAPKRVPMSALLGGRDLPAGTYYLRGRMNGVKTTQWLHNSALLCTDVMIGTPPPGTDAICAVSERSGRALFAPDPAKLED